MSNNVEKVIDDLTKEKAHIEDAITALSRLRNGKPSGPAVQSIQPIEAKPKRTMSLAARRKISKVQKARWAELRKAQARKAA